MTPEKILIIDDSKVIRMQILDSLKRVNAIFREAKNGREALEILEEEGETFTLIILDWVMPKVGGDEVFRRIQDDPNLRRIPLILMSGEKTEVDRTLSPHFYQYCEFLKKPFPKSEFLRAIALAQAKAKRDRDPSNPEQIAPKIELEKKEVYRTHAADKILLIDDSKVIRMRVSEILRGTGTTILEAKDGQRALELIDSEGENLSLILLDWLLPKVSGAEVFWRIQSDPELQKLPLLLMSGRKIEVDERLPQRFYQYCEHIEKPFDRDNFFRAIASAKEKANQPHPFTLNGDRGFPLHAVGKPALVFEDNYQVYAHNGWIFREGYLGDITLLRHSLDSQQLLHAEGEAAIAFSDGYRLYFHHGVRLPEKYGQLHPSRWKSEWLLAEENAELRRILIREIGYGRICQELRSVESDSWEEYALLRIENPQENEPICLLKMTCPSTGSIHALRVPPDVTSAREAIRWVNWGIDPEEFSIQT